MLPDAVRLRIVALAAAALAGLPSEAVPASLRKVARFTPAKRARLGAAELLAALASEPVFRQRVVEVTRDLHPDLDLHDGPHGAAVAYVLAVPGWEELVAAQTALEQERSRSQAADDLTGQLRRLTEQLADERATSAAELADALAEAEAARTELAEARRRLRELGSRLGRAEQGQREAEAALEQERVAVEAADATRVEAVRRAQDRAQDAERALEQFRAGAREDVRADQLRLRLLLDAVVGAAQGLRRELALPPAEGRPADALAADYPPPPVATTAQGRAADDPIRLDALLAIPTTHLMIDGYNVTKTGYGGLTLEAQRARLLAGAGALAARTGAEVTVVFDGAEPTLPVAVAAPRGVRLLFSRRGETADEVLRRLARQEPQGRPVVVVSSDKEVADGVRQTGAHSVPALSLLRLLERSVGPGS